MSNPPIYVTGNTPVISVNVGDYDNFPIIVYLTSLDVSKRGFNVTVRNNDGVSPGARRIIISTIQPDPDLAPLKFSDGTDTYLLSYNAGESFTTTFKDNTKWMKEITVIQGNTLLNREDIIGYGANVSSMVVSSFSTNASIYVQGTSIFNGPLIGLISPTFVTSVSTFLFSTGTLYTSTLQILEGIQTSFLTASNVTTFSTNNASRLSSLFFESVSTFTSSFTLINNNTLIGQARFIASNGALTGSFSDGTYTYATLEQSGYSNISTQIAPTVSSDTVGGPVSSLSTIMQNSLVSARYDPGLSSFSTSIRKTLDALTLNYGLTDMSNAFDSAMSSINASIGISSIYRTTQLGLSTVAAVPGAVLLSTNISRSLSSLAVQPGLSSISSIIGPGLSSITAFVPISTLSTSISLSASTVAATYGIQDLSTVVSYALSSVAANTGMNRISSIFAYGISSIAAGPGLSSLSTTIFSTASTFKSGQIVSTMSSLISYGLSSLVANTAFSSLQSTLIIGLSSILDYGYLPYSNARGLVTSTNITGPGVSSLLGTLSTGLSTISDGPGISSISSFFPISLSTIAIGPGLSSLSTVISRSLSSIFVPMPFPPTYSTQSTIISSLYLRDFSSGQYALFQLSGENILLSTIHYPERLSYLNSSTISTLVYEAKGSTTMSSIVVSSMNLTSSFLVQGILTTSLTAQRTLVSSLTMTDTVTGLQRDLVFINSVPHYTTVDGLQPFINTCSTTASTISTAYGYGILDLTENVNYLTVSTITPFALSSISLDLGLQTIEATANSNLLPNKSTISTLNLFASTVTVQNLRTVSFSTSLISTLFVSAQTLYISSLRTFNAQISSIASATVSTNQVLGENITASSISTGTLRITSSLVTSSFNIHNSLAIASTVSTGRLNISTLNFNPINTSTIFGASGLLNIGWGGGFTLNSLQTRAISGGQQQNFFGFLRGVSVPSIYVSTIYTSSIIVSSAISSYFVDVQGVVSSGNSFYGGFDSQTTLDQFIERDRESSIRGFGINSKKTGHKSWGLFTLYNQATATSHTAIRPSVFGMLNLPGLYNTNADSFGSNSVVQINQFNNSTLTALYDGKKILLGGVDYGSASGSELCIGNYIIPASYSNFFSNAARTTNPSYIYYQSTTTTIFPDSRFVRCRNIAWNGSIYIATGNAGTTAGTIKYSFDGFTWSNCRSGGWPTAGGGTEANNGGWQTAWNGYMWVCVGSNTILNQAAQYSYDGIGWTPVTSGTNGGLLQKIVYRNNVWTAGGEGYSDCNLKYSFDGLVWSNCKWSGYPAISGTNNGGLFTALFVGPRYVIASFYLGYTGAFGSGVLASNTAVSTNTYFSFDGINFTFEVPKDPTNGNLSKAASILQPIYDGNNIFVVYNNINNANTPTPTGDTSIAYGRNISFAATSINGMDNPFIRASLWKTSQGTSGIRSVFTPGVANSNVIPSLTMSNLEIYGSNFQPLLKSTNTIVGHANNTAMTSNGDNAYSERQNILMINDTLEIVAHLSTQIKINTPGNPNTVSTNFMNFPRETLDVLCTMNVSQAGMTRGFCQIGSGLRASTLGDRQYDVHFGRSTFVNSITIGCGATSNDYFSTPRTFFETYCAPGSYVTFRETTCNDTIVKNLLNATGLTTGVTCYPMVTGSDKNLVYYFKNQTNTFKFIDTTGTTFFTGQHPTNCIDIPISSVNDYVGKLVTVADQGYTIYTPTGQKVTGKDAILITSATPVTKLATTDMDPNVFGVVTNAFNNGINSDGTVNSYLDSKFTEDLYDRIMVNSIGEGAIWVSNYSGNVSNGDYLCSSPIPGLARKQDDGRLWNYTVAKATMSCDFNPPFVSSISTFIWEGSTLSTIVSCLAYKCEPVDYNGSSFLQAFIGCTYHCG